MQAFLKFWPYAKAYNAPILAEIIERDATQNVQYLEIMITPDENESGELAKKIHPSFDFTKMQMQLEGLGLAKNPA